MNHGQIRHHRSGLSASGSSSASQRTVFHNALEASQLTWTDQHLQNIMKQKHSNDNLPGSSLSPPPPPPKKEQYNSNNLPLWNGEDKKKWKLSSRV
jgi:hypothetical protein